MRTLTAFTIGATLTILCHIAGWPLMHWALARNLPATPANWAPRHRTWTNGIENT